MLRVDDDRLRGHGDHRIEIARRQRVREVAEIVGQKRLHQREIRGKRRVQQVLATVDLELALALLHDGPDAGGREDASEAVARRADTLDKRALGDQLDLYLS